MNATSLFDASELTAFADKLLAKGVARRAAITMAVKKGAQNVKNDLREDTLQLRQQGIPTHPNHLHGEGSAGTHFRRDRPYQGRGLVR